MPEAMRKKEPEESRLPRIELNPEKIARDMNWPISVAELLVKNHQRNIKEISDAMYLVRNIIGAKNFEQINKALENPAVARLLVENPQRFVCAIFNLRERAVDKYYPQYQEGFAEELFNLKTPAGASALVNAPRNTRTEDIVVELFEVVTDKDLDRKKKKETIEELTKVKTASDLIGIMKTGKFVERLEAIDRIYELGKRGIRIEEAVPGLIRMATGLKIGEDFKRGNEALTYAAIRALGSIATKESIVALDSLKSSIYGDIRECAKKARKEADTQRANLTKEASELAARLRMNTELMPLDESEYAEKVEQRPIDEKVLISEIERIERAAKKNDSKSLIDLIKNSEYVHVRIEAIKALAQFGRDKATMEALEKSAKDDKHVIVRQTAQQALELIPLKEAEKKEDGKTMVEAIENSKDPLVRKIAVMMLGQISEERKYRGVRGLLLALNDSDEQVRLTAAKVLTGFGKDARILDALLKSAHGDNSVEVMDAALRSLWQITIDESGYYDGGVKARAADALNEGLKLRAEADTLAIMTESERKQIEIIRSAENRDARGVLISAISNSEHEIVRSAAALALGRLGKPSKEANASKISDVLTKALQDKSELVRAAAAKALENFAGVGSTDVLKSLYERVIKDNSLAVRDAAQAALDHIASDTQYDEKIRERAKNAFYGGMTLRRGTGKEADEAVLYAKSRDVEELTRKAEAVVASEEGTRKETEDLERMAEVFRSADMSEAEIKKRMDAFEEPRTRPTFPAPGMKDLARMRELAKDKRAEKIRLIRERGLTEGQDYIAWATPTLTTIAADPDEKPETRRQAIVTLGVWKVQAPKTKSALEEIAEKGIPFRNAEGRELRMDTLRSDAKEALANIETARAVIAQRELEEEKRRGKLVTDRRRKKEDEIASSK